MDLRTVEPFDELMCTRAFEHEGTAVPEGAVGWVVKSDPEAGTLDLIVSALWPSATLQAVPARNFSCWSSRGEKSDLMSFLNSAYHILSESEAQGNLDRMQHFPEADIGSALDRIG